MKLKCRTVQVAVSAMLALAVCIAVASCAAPPMEETKTMDLETAKGIAMAMEDEVTALVPVENAGEQTQFETAHLLGCGDELYSWSGQSTVVLVGGVDAEAILESIAVMWERKPGVAVERKDERVDMTGTQGDFYSADVWESGTILKIDSFSPCFPLEDGQHPGDEY